MDIAAMVKRILKAKRWRQEDLAEAVGASQPSVGRWVKGTAVPQGPSYLKLLAIDAEINQAAPVDRARPVKPAFVSIPISGKVAAGLFQEVDDFENQDPDEAIVPRDPRWPQARILVFDVDGGSMNDFDPPIVDGARVSGPVFEDINVPLQNGMPVVVQRSSADGQMLEWSVKELEVRDDGYTFHPRSTDPRYKPIVVDSDFNADDGKSVQVIALVTDITRPTKWGRR